MINSLYPNTIYAVKDLEIIQSNFWKIKGTSDDYYLYNSKKGILGSKSEYNYKARVSNSSCYSTLEKAEEVVAKKIKKKIASLRKTFEAKMADLQIKYENLKTLN